MPELPSNPDPTEDVEPDPPYTPEWLEWARKQPDFCEMCGGYHSEPLLCQVRHRD